jgi:branched-chain amino acid transport system ATP-binding protein
MSAAPLLSLDAVQAYYGSSHILHGVSFAMAPGSVVALLGRNGVGKTTTLQSILGLPVPRGGRITFRGEPISGLPTHEIVRRGIGWVPQGHRIFPTLSVAENLMLAARKARPGVWTLERIYDLFPWMRERGNARGGHLSGGEQQMLAIARALIQNPALILMDEPSEGLSPRIVEEIGAIVGRLEREGCAVFVVEQNLAFALRIARQVMVMNKGAIVFDGSAEALSAQPEIAREYLGVAAAAPRRNGAGR